MMCVFLVLYKTKHSIWGRFSVFCACPCLFLFFFYEDLHLKGTTKLKCSQYSCHDTTASKFKDSQHHRKNEFAIEQSFFLNFIF